MVALAHVSPFRLLPSHISGGSTTPLPHAVPASTALHMTFTESAALQPRASVTVAVMLTVPAVVQLKCVMDAAALSKLPESAVHLIVIGSSGSVAVADTEMKLPTGALEGA